MIKRLFILTMCLMAGMAMTAAHITPQQARSVAQQFMRQKVAKHGHATAAATMQALPCALDAEGKVVAYAVNMGDNDGFVIVDGNDPDDGVIGYCDHGTFDAQKMPANMRSWLESYTRNARHATATSKAARKRAASRHQTKTYIAPMLQCQWDQSAPYNDLCPLVDGKRCATGCTITAVAQLMFHHRWPVGPTGAIPAFTPDNSEGTTHPSLPALEPTTFNWDKIYPSYKNHEDGSEVARLFQYMGTAAKTKYGSESSALGYDAVQALINYFGYDAGAQTIWRDQMSYDEWLDKIYAELQASRPVMFSGTSANTAHSFVIDGYDEEDYFHINWGWSGYCDGFYRAVLMDARDLTDPNSTSDDSFSIDQVAFFGVRPDAGQKAEPARLTVLKNWLLTDPKGTGDYDTPGNEATSPYFEGNGYVVLPVMNSHNYNSIAGEFNLGCTLVKDDNSVMKSYEWDPAKFKVHEGFNDHSKAVYIDPVADPTLTDGDYTLYFTSKLKNDDQWQYDNDSENHYIRVRLDHANGHLSAASVSNDYKLSVVDIKFANPTVVVNEPCKVTVTLHNSGTGAFHGDVGMITDKNGSPEWLDAMGCDVEPNETTQIGLSFTPTKTGTINYRIENNKDKTLYNGSFTVVESDATGDCDLTVTHKVVNAEGTEIIGPKAQVDITVTNNGDKPYKGEIYLYCFKWNGENQTFDPTYQEATIPAGQTVVLRQESAPLTGGERYSFTTMYMKGEQQVEQTPSDVYYTTVPYYIAYDAGGNAGTFRLTATLQPQAGVCAVDLTGTTGVTSVNTSANPNMIILAAEDATLTGDNIVKGTQAENVKLTDGYPFYCPTPFKARHISYTRTPDIHYDALTGKGWSSLVLPFAPTACHATIDGVDTPLRWRTNGADDGDIFLVTYEYENGNDLEFMLPVAALYSCNPYLLGIPSSLSNGKSLVNVPVTFQADNADVTTAKAVVTGYRYKMMGTFAPVQSSDGLYVLGSDGAAFVPATRSAVNPFRAFVVPLGDQSPASKLSIKFNLETHTGIGQLNSDPQQQQDVYYNLNGQRVTRPGKGIHIVNGKKVIF